MDSGSGIQRLTIKIIADSGRLTSNNYIPAQLRGPHLNPINPGAINDWLAQRDGTTDYEICGDQGLP
jgi:hypothetical protein